MPAVTFVLVIACTSVASLLLARTESRRREFSLRRAIGADEARLVRLMLAESAWVVLISGEKQLYAVEPLDVVSFAITAGIMIATALVASLVPALRALRVDPIIALRGE